jgi:NAD-dependent SIR2 family protein deacetylase
MQDGLNRAAQAIANAEALLITAGAGMGVDSGLPDFRGPEGFWQAYPPFRKLGLKFHDLANPYWFERDPELAWGFYGHRLHLYQNTTPHEGYHILRRWCAHPRLGAFVFTSNVDGQFQKAGFDPERIVEVHGSLGWMQCTRSCGVGIVPSEGVRVAVDEATMRARPPLPACSRCGALARPNVLMFGDSAWDPSRSDRQERRLYQWLRAVRGGSLVLVELGAGTAVPTVRTFGEGIATSRDAFLVRINVREPETPQGHVGIPLGALAALRALEARMGSDSGDRVRD